SSSAIKSNTIKHWKLLIIVQNYKKLWQ
ncbi:Long-chain-fatty-acid--CoA ligase FadD15, partial [Haemophilus influenzae]